MSNIRQKYSAEYSADSAIGPTLPTDQPLTTHSLPTEMTYGIGPTFYSIHVEQQNVIPTQNCLIENHPGYFRANAVANLSPITLRQGQI